MRSDPVGGKRIEFSSRMDSLPLGRNVCTHLTFLINPITIQFFLPSPSLPLPTSPTSPHPILASSDCTIFHLGTVQRTASLNAIIIDSLLLSIALPLSIF